MMSSHSRILPGPAKAVALIVGVWLASSMFSAAWAQLDNSASRQREIEMKVLAITDQLRCPTCQGTSVKDSDASFSRQIKDKVRVMVEEGQTEEMIKAYFVSRYGEWILRAPKREGIGLVLWYSPVVLLFGIGALLVWRVRRNARVKTEPAAPAPAQETDVLTPEQRDKISRDLQRFESQD